MKLDSEWVDKQLAASLSTPPINDIVKKLIAVLEDTNVNDDIMRIALDKFHRLALGYALEPAKPTERWGPVIPGAYNIGDTVRVRTQAYDGALGQRHNGRRGRVTGVRNAQTVVMYDDAKSTDEQYHHDPRKLERLL